MITEKNLFEKGMMIAVHAGSYGGRRKLDKTQLQGLPTEIVRGVHDIFDKEFKDILRDIERYNGETRSTIRNRSIPFPIDGVYFVASDKIESMIEYIEEREAGRKELVEKAINNYDEAVERFAQEYPEFYEKAKSKYIDKYRLNDRYYFNYQLIKISAPDQALISPEQYKKEVEKFKETVNQMKGEVLATIYEELVHVTKRLKKQCTDGKPNQRTLNNLNTFLERIDDTYSDFLDRKDMKATIKKIKAQILGVEADQLRESEDAKEEFRKGISGILDEIKAMPDIPLKRAIEF